MRELILEGRVAWSSDRPGRDRTLAVGPARIPGPAKIPGLVRIPRLLRIVAALGFVAGTALVAAVVAAAVGAVAAGLGARWTARRREQGLDDPVAIVQQRVGQAREWIDARRSSQDNAPGSDL